MSLPRLVKPSEHADNNKQQQLVRTEKERKWDTCHVRRRPKSFLGFSKRQRFLRAMSRTHTPHATATKMHVKSSCLFSPISSFFHFILWYSNFSHRRFMYTHSAYIICTNTCAVKVNSQMIMWSWQCSMPRIAQRDTRTHTLFKRIWSTHNEMGKTNDYREKSTSTSTTHMHEDGRNVH